MDEKSLIFFQLNPNKRLVRSIEKRKNSARGENMRGKKRYV